MSDKGNFFTVAAYMVTGLKHELIFFEEDDATTAHDDLCKAIEEKKRIWRWGDDYGFDICVNIRAIVGTHMISLKDSHKRTVDIQDTQEVISNKYEHEHFGSKKAGFRP